MTAPRGTPPDRPEGRPDARSVGGDALVDPVSRAVTAFRELWYRGDAPDVEDYCRECPEHEEALRQAIDDFLYVAEGLPALTGATRSLEPIGPYEILSVLGEGGMGTVYLAKQSTPVERRVALKVIKPGMDSRQVLARFEGERRTLALMNHDNIARVFDAGTTTSGLPYFVMEHVDGEPIVEHCERAHVALRDRLALMIQVCHGVNHAHQKGIIHRDLKPSNVLVTLQDDRPVPKIIDFGLARAMDARLTEQPMLTQVGNLLGTPAYMSPEQVTMDSAQLDTRTDVYSLGVVLYELLTGTLPFGDLGRLSTDTLRRQICEEQPERPSRRIALPSERGAIGRDLDWVVLKALAKDRDERYATPRELAADLHRFLRHEPVHASPPSVYYRLRKYVRRNRIALSVAAVLLASSVVSLWLFFEMRTSAEEARRSATSARESARATETALAASELRRKLLMLLFIEDAANSLYPAWPENVARMKQWLADMGDPIVEASDDLDAMVTRDGMTGRWDPLLAAKARAGLKAVRDGLVTRVREDVAWAERVRTVSIDDHRRAWDEAIAAIRASDGKAASRRYRGLTIKPQIGLVPIGADRTTGLWEFAHLRSGVPGTAVPARDEATGRLKYTTDHGFVFVLVPGGTFNLGAQRNDPEGPNYDADAELDEVPVQSVTLAPFFLSKYEMTQAQWKRLSGGLAPSKHRPGRYGPQRTTLLSPVEFVNFLECRALLGPLGVELPTEAQWEYACRAGTTTPRWTGRDVESLAGKENVRDLTAQEACAPFARVNVAPFHDGFVVTAPVDSLAPNPFGLHHMHGNVLEWCLDVYYGYGDAPRRAGDGAVTSPGLERIIRGQAFQGDPRSARSADRYARDPKVRYLHIGLRPARVLHR